MGGVEVKDQVAFLAFFWTLTPTFNEEYANTLWTAGVVETDRLICKELTIFYGPLEVQFAVYNNAVEAHFEVELVNCEVHDGIEVFGTIVARNTNVPDSMARCKLFDRSVDDVVHFGPDNDGMKLPLTRSVAVVPLGSTIFVDVLIWQQKNQLQIFEKLNFDAALADKETKVASGNVEVTVTWSR